MLLRTSKYSFLVGIWLTMNILFISTLALHTWKTVLVSLALWFLIGCLGLEVHFHRKCCHSDRPLDWKSKFLTIVGHLGCQGSAIFFSATHLRHHQFADQSRDPHSPKFGFWHAYVGWSTERRHVLYGLAGRLANPHLKNSPIFRFLHSYYIEFVWLTWLITYLMSPTALVCLVTAQFLSFNQSAFFVNIMTHTKFFLNSSKYSTDAYNNPLAALMSWGVGLHDFHHKFPRKHYYAENPGEIDVSGSMIRLFWSKDSF